MVKKKMDLSQQELFVKQTLLNGERNALFNEENRLRTMYEDLQTMRVKLEERKSELQLGIEENTRSIDTVTTRLSHLDLEMLDLMEKRDKVQRVMKASKG